MKFAHALPAPAARSIASQRVAWILAGILVIMAVGQLFSFEKFIPLLDDYWLPGGTGMATLVACLIVIVEVFALPFLLRMPLSPLMRWVSLGCTVIAVAVWVKLSLWTLFMDHAATNSGLLGTKVAVPAGVASLVFTLALAVLAGLSVWGLWPHRKK